MNEALVLPNLLIFGAVKSGTGALHQYLDHHPEIYMSPLKEPKYFLNQTGDNNAAPTTLEDYSKEFRGAKAEKVIGESSSNYIYSHAAGKRIHETIPNAKLIASLRNPVNRACAHYLMTNNDGNISSQLLSRNNERWAKASLYADHIQYYSTLFPPDQLKILIYEEWTTQVNPSLQDLYKFLEVDRNQKLPSYANYRPATALWKQSKNNRWKQRLRSLVPPRVLAVVKQVLAARKKQPEELIPYNVRREMFEWYREDIERLEEILKRDLSAWKVV